MVVTVRIPKGYKLVNSLLHKPTLFGEGQFWLVTSDGSTYPLNRDMVLLVKMREH